MAVDIYKPQFMIRMVEQMPPLHTFLKTTFFNQVVRFPTESVTFDVKKGGMSMAPFVHSRIGSVVLERQGYKTETYKPPLVAPKRVLTTDDLDARLPGEALFNGLRPGQRQIELLQNDLIELDNAITRREEWMCAKLLCEGRIHVVGEGIDEMIDFGFENLIDVDVPWDDFVNSDPMQDLNMAIDKIAETGHSANIAIADNETMRIFIRNRKLKELLDIKNFSMGIIAPEIQRNGVTYYGFLPECGLYLYGYNGKYADNDNPNPDYPDVQPGDKGFVPKVHSLITKGRVIVASTSMPTAMLYGVIKDLQIGNFMRARVPKQWDQQEPSERYVKISSRPLPCPKDIDTWVVLDVLGDESDGGSL